MTEDITLDLIGLNQPWERLARLNEIERFPSVIRLIGPRGQGKATLVHILVNAFLQDQKLPLSPYGLTPWDATKPTPAFLVCPMDEKGSIKVEHIRTLKERLMGRHDVYRRIVLVDNMETMTPQAANALLKILEEAPARTTFMLIDHGETPVLPTIRSRCLSLPCPPLSLTESLSHARAMTMNQEEAFFLAAYSQGAYGRMRMLHQDERYKLYQTLLMMIQKGKFSQTLYQTFTSHDESALEELIKLFVFGMERFLLWQEDGLASPLAEEEKLFKGLSTHHERTYWQNVQKKIQQQWRDYHRWQLPPKSVLLTLFQPLLKVA